ncbi:uncharacterized protein LOC144107553 isoform X2 [Amblyomma americanum]
MSHMYCCAKWCSTSGKSGGHFFSVPADHRFSTWLKYANRLELLLTPRAKVHKTYRLCSKHFTRDCFTSDTRTRLTREAVPSVKVQEPRLRALVHPDFYDERVAQGIGSTAPSQSQPSTAPVEVMLGHDYLPLPPMLEPGTVAGADSAVHDTDGVEIACSHGWQGGSKVLHCASTKVAQVDAAIQCDAAVMVGKGSQCSIPRRAKVSRSTQCST